jgi:hypothetical protein
MYKQASKLKLRFNTTKGILSVEQLWDLSLPQLDDLAVSLESQHKNSKAKSFLATKTSKDKTIKLQFDIVLDILNTKVEEANNASKALSDKEHNQKILAQIAINNDKELEGKSNEELEKMLKK